MAKNPKPSDPRNTAPPRKKRQVVASSSPQPKRIGPKKKIPVSRAPHGLDFFEERVNFQRSLPAKIAGLRARPRSGLQAFPPPPQPRAVGLGCGFFSTINKHPLTA